MGVYPGTAEGLPGAGDQYLCGNLYVLRAGDFGEVLRVKQVQLLPYRKMGTEKYASMGIPYPMGEDYKMPPREVWEANIRHLVGIMQEYGVPAVPGSSERIEL